MIKAALVLLTALVFVSCAAAPVQAATERVSGFLSFNINSAPPSFDNLANHTHTANTSFSYDLDATDDVALDSFWFNDTSVFVINISSGLITNTTALNVIGTYWINVSVNDTGGLVAWAIFYIDVVAPAAETDLGLIEGKWFLEKWLAFTFIQFPIDTDSIMPVNSMYYSTDHNKLVYKDPDGAVHEVY